MLLLKKFSKGAAAIAVTTLAVALMPIQKVFAQQSYPMICRGGGSIVIANDGSGGVRIEFQPGSGAAHQGLNPGQCTWSDRALSSGEPTTICDSGSSAAHYVAALVQPDQYPILQVYNDGRGCMIVTRVGP